VSISRAEVKKVLTPVEKRGVVIDGEPQERWCVGVEFEDDVEVGFTNLGTFNDIDECIGAVKKYVDNK